tara:strand:- start:121 stop:624 length:504 start_codon:yes stop_codon:yes gene_type:complete
MPLSEIVFRLGERNDLSQIIRLLADDSFSGDLESAQDVSTDRIPMAYQQAWEAIFASGENQILVAADGMQVIAVLQLTMIPSLTLRGSRRAQIEGVRVASVYRGQGVGTQLMQWAIDLAKKENCLLVQLTMDRRRERAVSFYRRLGFVASHEGFKMQLDQQEGFGNG